MARSVSSLVNQVARHALFFFNIFFHLFFASLLFFTSDFYGAFGLVFGQPCRAVDARLLHLQQHSGHAVWHDVRRWRREAAGNGSVPE
jgi:hypothetical protein